MSNKQYSEEFKRETVKRITSKNLTYAQAARETGLHVNTVRKWVTAAPQHHEDAFVGKGNLHVADKERRVYEKRIKELEEENAILKKVAVVFAKNPNKTVHRKESHRSVDERSDDERARNSSASRRDRQDRQIGI